MEIMTKSTGPDEHAVTLAGPLIVNPHVPPKMIVLTMSTRPAGLVGGLRTGVVPVSETVAYGFAAYTDWPPV